MPRPLKDEIAIVSRGVTGKPDDGVSVCFSYGEGFFVQELTYYEALQLGIALADMSLPCDDEHIAVRKEKP